jgi:hypothetical protein
MGAGISAVIPLVLSEDSSRGIHEEKYFSKGFFDNFTPTDKEKVYVIKEDLLLDNYKTFLCEFYDLIDEPIERETGLTAHNIPNATAINEFKNVFSGEARNMKSPFVYHNHYSFSTLGCDCHNFWVFYNGSYKAYLETYETLRHFENILPKAMKNPLANAVKFGIFG